MKIGYISRNSLRYIKNNKLKLSVVFLAILFLSIAKIEFHSGTVWENNITGKKVRIPRQWAVTSLDEGTSSALYFENTEKPSYLLFQINANTRGDTDPMEVANKVSEVGASQYAMVSNWTPYFAASFPAATIDAIHKTNGMQTKIALFVTNRDYLTFF